MNPRPLGLSVVALSLAAAACASGPSEPPDESSPPPAATSAATSPGPTASSPSSTASPLIEDGRNFAFIKSVDTRGDPVTVTYDLAYLLHGEEAAKAAREHGDEAPPPNDYYIVNDNPRLRTVPLAAGAEIVLLDWKHCCDDTFEGSLEDFAKAINDGMELTVGAKIYKGGISPYWLIARGGTIVRIEEQYLP